jgi:preprotein translocase subunit YajC
MSDSIAIFFAQVTNAVGATGPDAAAQQPQQPWWVMFAIYGLLFVMLYFAFFRPQSLAKKKQEDLIKGAKTGDKIVTTSGIHGVITNVKDSTVIVKVADNVKLELEKSHIDKVTRPDSNASDSDKLAVTKA